MATRPQPTPPALRRQLRAERPADRCEYEAARLDPTTDRDQWDLFGDDELERPGDGDEW